jgi:hypothetical protein
MKWRCQQNELQQLMNSNETKLASKHKLGVIFLFVGGKIVSFLDLLVTYRMMIE